MIRISYLPGGERDNHPRGADVTWDQLAIALGRDTVEPSPCTVETCGKGEHEHVTIGRDGKERRGGCRHKYIAAWSPAVYPPGATRANANVGVVSLLVLDLDHKTDAELADIVARLGGHKYIAHGSHGDQRRVEREGAIVVERAIRVVLLLSEPVLGADWSRFRAAALAKLGIADSPDPATKEAARLYFLPTRRSDCEFRFDDHDGAPIDVPAILAKAGPRDAGPDRDRAERAYPPASLELLGRVRERLANHAPAIEGRGGDNHTYNAACIAVRDYALRDEEALEVLLAWNRTCVPPWSVDELRAKIENARAHGTGRIGESREADSLLDALATCDRAASVEPQVPTEGDVLAILGSISATNAPRLAASDVASALYGGGLRSFLGEDDPGDDPDAWLIRGFMPASVPVVIGGHPKSLKTWLALLTAICIAAGRPLPFRPNDPVKRARVLVLAREDSVRETRKRLWRISRGLTLDPRELDGWLQVDSKTPFYFSSPDDVARMRRSIEAFRPALIVIDSLSRTHQGDENSKKEMSIVTSTWGDLCQEYELALAPIHHYTKNGEGSLLQKLRGSGDIGALVRHIIGVEKQGDGSTELSFEGNLHPLPEPFLVRMVDDVTADGKKCVRFEGGESSTNANRDRIDREIAEAVAASAPTGLTAREIREAVKGKSDAIDKRRDALVKANVLFKHGSRWHAVSVVDHNGNAQPRRPS